MIQANLKKEEIVSGTGRKYKFDKNLYLKVVDFIIKKHDVTDEQARCQLNWFIINGNKLASSSKKITNIRLKNIIELEYEWTELW